MFKCFINFIFYFYWFFGGVYCFLKVFFVKFSSLGSFCGGFCLFVASFVLDVELENVVLQMFH